MQHRPGQEKAVAGYIMDEARTIRIDAVTGTVVLQGVRSTFDRNLAIIQQDDMFIAARAISSWFPVNITTDKAQQIVTLAPREKLPLQQLLERKARSLELKKASLDDDPSFTDITPPIVCWRHPLWISPPPSIFPAAISAMSSTGNP